MDSRASSGPVNAVDPEVGSEPSALACLVRVARHHGMHLSVSQLMHDNVLATREVTTTDLLKCAQSAGLKAKALKLTWNGLADLGKALPAIVRLKHGPSMVLQRVDAAADVPRVVLFDPLADDDTELVIDRVRFEEAWSGEVVLVKRNYDLADESQPFSLGLIVALIFRERRIVRDVAISAMVLGILGLTPIVFWRLMSDKVIYYKAFNTFYVLCLGYLVLLAFEAVFAWLRRILVLHITTRVDVKLSTYMFDKLLNLPIDFFERTQVGKIMLRHATVV